MALSGQATTGGGQPIIIQGLQPQQMNFQGAQLIQAQLPQLANQIFINANHHQASATPSPLSTPGVSTPGPQQQQQQQHQTTPQGATIQIHQPNLSQQVAAAQQQQQHLHHHQQQVQVQVQQQHQQQQVQQIQMQANTPQNN